MGLPHLSTIALGCLMGADAFRLKRQHTSAKTIAGIPVLNYDQAYGGKASLAEVQAEQDWLIVAKDGTSDDELSKFCASTKAGCKAVGHPSEKGVAFFELVGTEAELEAVLGQAPGKIRFIEPNLPVAMIPEITEAPENSYWGLERIGAADRTSQGEGVHIYVLDTGVRDSHREFGGRAVPTLDMSIKDTAVVCSEYSGSCAQDVQGHGTHCAATAGGATAGVAPKAAIHSVKVLSDQGSGDWSWSIGALDWLATEGARPAVASMSLGGRGRMETMSIAVDASVQAGIVVSVAGGNSNDDACNYSPAFVTAAITVGSTTKEDARSTFSNYGRCTDIWAPGSYILSAGHTSDTEYRTLSGTSMACPHVSGAAALLLAQDGSLTAAGVLKKIKANAAVNYIDGLYSQDANRLLFVGSTPPPPLQTTTAPKVCKENSYGPDEWGDCVCDPGYDCWWGDYGGCPYVGTEATGIYHRFYYLPTCATCKCWAMR